MPDIAFRYEIYVDSSVCAGSVHGTVHCPGHYYVQEYGDSVSCMAMYMATNLDKGKIILLYSQGHSHKSGQGASNTAGWSQFWPCGQNFTGVV